MKSKGNQSEELIRVEAYLLSERAGHPPGMEAIFWAQAAALVGQRKPGGKTAGGKSTATKKAGPAGKVAAKVVTKPTAAKRASAAKPAANGAPVAKPAPAKTARKPKAQGAADRNRRKA